MNIMILKDLKAYSELSIIAAQRQHFIAYWQGPNVVIRKNRIDSRLGVTTAEQLNDILNKQYHK